MAIKYKFLAELLRSDIVKNGDRPGYKIPTENELMQRYSMSRQTVRHALQLLTKEGLVQSRQGSGTYSTGRIGAVGKSTTRQIAVVTSFLDDYIFPTILHDAQGVFSEAEYTTLIFATENCVSNERLILQKLLQEPPAGILVEGSKTALPNPNIALYQQLQKMGVPIVFLHGIYRELANIPCVGDDNFKGGSQLAQYLIAKKHTKIAGIFKSDDIQGLQRYHGVVCALCENDVPVQDNRFIWYDTQTRAEMMENRDMSYLQFFIKKRLQKATAVICYNDEIAFLLIQELLSAGFRVPEDVAVVSFDNSYYSQMSQVAITSLRHKGQKMGSLAAQQLLQLLHGQPGMTQTLPWELIARASG